MKALSSYKNTSVNWAKSQADIGKLLEKNEIKETRFTTLMQDTIPVKLEGRCCDICNSTKVIPARLKKIVKIIK